MTNHISYHGCLVQKHQEFAAFVDEIDDEHDYDDDEFAFRYLLRVNLISTAVITVVYLALLGLGRLF